MRNVNSTTELPPHPLPALPNDTHTSKSKLNTSSCLPSAQEPGFQFGELFPLPHPPSSQGGLSVLLKPHVLLPFISKNIP